MEKNPNHEDVVFGGNKYGERFIDKNSPNLGAGTYKNTDPFNVHAPSSSLNINKLTIAGADYTNTKILHKKIE